MPSGSAYYCGTCGKLLAEEPRDWVKGGPAVARAHAAHRDATGHPTAVLSMEGPPPVSRYQRAGRAAAEPKSPARGKGAGPKKAPAKKPTRKR